MCSTLAAVAAVAVTIKPVTATESAHADMIKRGQYIAKLGGCNDCHTPGYLMNEGNIPVDQWLKGSDFGWRGPWGTTYPPNLRLFVSKLTEDEWVEKAKTLKRRPPMPWFNLNTMTETDLRALYRFIRSLGDPGPQAPEFVPPGEEPHTAYALFPSPPPEAK
jgi:mono/diheme cytochrome c family protein